MTPFDRFLLQTDSFIIIIALIVYLFKALSRNQKDSTNEIRTESNEVSADAMTVSKIAQKSGYAEGEIRIAGIEDDEAACAIMAAVSTASMIPLNSLRIKSIKAIESK